MRGFMASVLLGIGYLLVFSAVADGGKYALRPWDALWAAA